MKVVIGIDEVGRGPIAGPVAVAAFSVSSAILRKAKSFRVPLRDSKQLTRAQREAWYAEILSWQHAGICDFSVTMVSAKEIDRIGIAPAIRKALSLCLRSVKAEASHTVLLDGGLKAPEIFRKQKTIIKGDESQPAISLASIVAKVTRDRHMLRIAKKFPAYGFDRHVGYGTKAHYAAIREYGPSEIHRISFLRTMH